MSRPKVLEAEDGKEKFTDVHVYLDADYRILLDWACKAKRYKGNRSQFVRDAIFDYAVKHNWISADGDFIRDRSEI